MFYSENVVGENHVWHMWHVQGTEKSENGQTSITIAFDCIELSFALRNANFWTSFSFVNNLFAIDSAFDDASYTQNWQGSQSISSQATSFFKHLEWRMWDFLYFMFQGGETCSSSLIGSRRMSIPPCTLTVVMFPAKLFIDILLLLLFIQHTVLKNIFWSKRNILWSIRKNEYENW